MLTTFSDDPGINFVVLDGRKWADVLAGERADVAGIASRITTNEDIWIVLTYLRLSSIAVRVSISDRPQAGAINIVDGIHIDPMLATPDAFLVGCRGDGHYPAICQSVIHQNSIGRADEPSIYIPQWAQPAIVPRASARRTISNVGFMGHHQINLSKEFRDECFVRELRNRGYELIIRGKADSGVSWNDYSEVDVVLAIRDIPLAHLQNKPVNKLTNAWLAGVPAMMGAEPAVQAIRESPLDYFEIAKPADVFDVLTMLKTAPGLYERMVAHGRRRSVCYNDEAVARRWLEVLDGLSCDFRRWDSMSSARKLTDYQQRVEASSKHLTRHCELVHGGYVRLGHGERWWESGQAGEGEIGRVDCVA